MLFLVGTGTATDTWDLQPKAPSTSTHNPNSLLVPLAAAVSLGLELDERARLAFSVDWMYERDLELALASSFVWTWRVQNWGKRRCCVSPFVCRVSFFLKPLNLKAGTSGGNKKKSVMVGAAGGPGAAGITSSENKRKTVMLCAPPPLPPAEEEEEED
ncbi:hypothetical protein DL96DRAFT_1641693 [Flagelloscypha sp. PMI_526]|nr:hypothetical protein DL96DRAFT_1641693 [Flagelloscypha sp. PMI_526]